MLVLKREVDQSVDICIPRSPDSSPPVSLSDRFLSQAYKDDDHHEIQVRVIRIDPLGQWVQIGISAPPVAGVFRTEIRPDH